MQSQFRGRLIWIALALLAGLVAFAAAPVGLRAGGNNGASEGGGDNPVVGSLPCAVDPDMDLKFWKALGISPRTGVILRPVPTLSFAGQSLSRSIVDAWGAGGSVNYGGNSWTLLGLMQQGGMVTTRARVLTLQASLWTWLPYNMIGGRVTMTSNVGGWSVNVSENCFALPLPMLCAGSVLVPVEATFSVYAAGSGSPVVKYRVTVVGDVVTVSFL